MHQFGVSQQAIAENILWENAELHINAGNSTKKIRRNYS